jgi:hypothetical protein
MGGTRLWEELDYGRRSIRGEVRLGEELDYGRRSIMGGGRLWGVPFGADLIRTDGTRIPPQSPAGRPGQPHYAKSIPCKFRVGHYFRVRTNEQG